MEHMQMITWIVILLLGGVGSVLIYLLIKWGPLFSHLASSMEKELQSALQVSENIQQNAHIQMKSVWRQVASVQTAIDGVRSLRTLTAELEQYASEAQQLSQHLLAESHHSDIYPHSLIQHAESSAKHLSMTANRAHHVYQLLLRSIDQLASETEGVRSAGIDSERSVQELTGAVERARHMVADRRPLPSGEPRRKTRPPKNQLPEYEQAVPDHRPARLPERDYVEKRSHEELHRDPYGTRDRDQYEERPQRYSSDNSNRSSSEGMRRRSHPISRPESSDRRSYQYERDDEHSNEVPMPPRRPRHTQRPDESPRKDWLR